MYLFPTGALDAHASSTPSTPKVGAVYLMRQVSHAHVIPVKIVSSSQPTLRSLVLRRVKTDIIYLPPMRFETYGQDLLPQSKELMRVIQNASETAG